MVEAKVIIKVLIKVQKSCPNWDQRLWYIIHEIIYLLALCIKNIDHGGEQNKRYTNYIQNIDYTSNINYVQLHIL